MTRISLKEAYDNRDVIAWLATHQDAIEELQEILNNLPDPDLTNVVLKTGDQTIEGTKTFTDPIISQGGVTLASGGLHIGGDLQVDGDIIQEGSSYETHAEQVFSKNDLIVTREDAVGAIVAGGISGIRVNKYDGVNSLNLGVDSTGTMRVGDPTDEQPLLTRDESEDMTSGALLKWDGVNKKAIAPPSNIGSDTKPIKIVDGEPVAVNAEMLTTDSPIKILDSGTVVGLSGARTLDMCQTVMSVNLPSSDDVGRLHLRLLRDGNLILFISKTVNGVTSSFDIARL